MPKLPLSIYLLKQDRVPPCALIGQQTRVRSLGSSPERNVCLSRRLVLDGLRR